MRIVASLIVVLLNAGCALGSDLPLRAPEGPCVQFGGVDADHQWLKGHYEVLPVAQEHQGATIPRVRRGAVKDVSRAFAQAVTGNDALPGAAHYYLIRVGYVGLPGAVENVDFSVDVDATGVAYVSSFVLSKRTETAEAVAILASPTPLRQVISSCGSAE